MRRFILRRVAFPEKEATEVDTPEADTAKTNTIHLNGLGVRRNYKHCLGRLNATEQVEHACVPPPYHG